MPVRLCTNKSKVSGVQEMPHRFYPLAIALTFLVGVTATTKAQDQRLPDRQPGAQFDPQRNPQMPQQGQPGYVQPGQPSQYGEQRQPYQVNYYYGQQGYQGTGFMQAGYGGCGCDSGAMTMTYGGYGNQNGSDNCCC